MADSVSAMGNYGAGNYAVPAPTTSASGIPGSKTESVLSERANAAKGAVVANTGPITKLFGALSASIKGVQGPIDMLTKKITALGNASKGAASGRAMAANCWDPCGGMSGRGRGVSTGSTVFSSIKSSKDLAAPIAAIGRGGGGGGGGDNLPVPFGGDNLPVRYTGGGGGFGGGGGGGFGGGGGGGGFIPPNMPGGGNSGDAAGANTVGGGVMAAINNFMANVSGQNGIGGLLMSIPNAAASVYGALAGGGIQYAYNRINGPMGNQNQMLQLAGALGPQAGMMGLTVPQTVLGLSQKMPVMGTQEDMLQTALAGQSVGALMRGTTGRNGFFEAVRQMQILTPGADPGQMAGSMAGYLQNTQSQKMGMYLGEGAFTMVGKGGRFKSLAEWAEGIMRFMEQHRIGNQGQGFTKDELLSQNFPGSNINAWFQMLGVPQNMVDYWWNYALTNAGQISPVSVDAAKQTDQLRQNVQNVRGIDLSYERLRNVTQGTRRDYLMGNKMYGMYAARESADRRFNVAMQGTDAAIATMMSTTNVGALLSLLPTPVMEMLMPILTAVATSPVGAGAAAVGGVMGNFGDVPIGDAPVYGDAGATNTAHLSPSLAKRVQAMMAANPRLKITSGYRDSLTQNRLHRNGVGKVGPASTSAHTRGWAVDIGPKSEGGWLAANAGKFGLQSAAHKGEPWHIQMANTMTAGGLIPSKRMGDIPIGDPNADFPIGDSLFDSLSPTNIGKKVVGFLFDQLKDVMLMPFKMMTQMFSSLMKDFIGSGDLSKMIDKSTAGFSRLMTAPLAGLSNLLGSASFGPEEITGLINQKSVMSVPTVGFSGFQSLGSNSNSGQLVFGDPVSSLMDTGGTTVNANMGSPIIFNAEITINGMGTSQADAKRAASTLVDHLQQEVNKKKWLVS